MLLLALAAACGDAGEEGAFDGLDETAPAQDALGSAVVVEPGARSGASMAFDAARENAVLFGGEDDSGALGDTWVWDGKAWAPQNPLGQVPTPRALHALAYDAGRQQTVLFGGSDGEGVLGDTWVWDGLAWLLKPLTTSPPPRSGAAMASWGSGTSGEVVLFGGTDGEALGFFGDTWVWDGSTWSDVTNGSEPPARADAAISYDPVSGRVLLYGGRDALGARSDMWAWNGGSWSELSVNLRPPARFGAKMIYDASRGKHYLFGGGDVAGLRRDTFWSFDGSSWRQEPSLPAPRKNAAMAYDSVREAPVIFGGRDRAGRPQGDTWAWDGQDWRDSGIRVTPVIASGLAHTCAVRHDRTVWCWGANWRGQCGDRLPSVGLSTGQLDTISSLGASTILGGGVPYAVPGIDDALRAAAGDAFACAVRRDGSVWCWGGGHSSATPHLGTHKFVSPDYVAPSWRSTPASVSGIDEVIDVSAGGEQVCALRRDGSVSCWRAGAAPAPVALGSKAVSVSVGSGHACAALEDGSVRCWGENTWGQLGNGTTTDSASPVTVLEQAGSSTQALSGAVEVGAGGDFSCALKADGAVYCWGSNASGQLGLGSYGGSFGTARRTLASSVTQLGLGTSHACALDRESHVLCWGSGESIGRGSSGSGTPSPVLLAPRLAETPVALSRVVSIGGGSSHTCALTGDGTSFCWGPNSSGQLGNGTSQPRVVVSRVLSTPEATGAWLDRYATPSLFQP